MELGKPHLRLLERKRDILKKEIEKLKAFERIG
jgi:hypothetical protein